jgi:hypothetical protein
MSDQLYAKIGRLQTANDELSQNYDLLLGLLANVVTGKCDATRVLVNLTERSWTVAEEDCRPSLPATVNGLPDCRVSSFASRKDQAEAMAAMNTVRDELNAANAEIARLKRNTEVLQELKSSEPRSE